LASNGYIGLLIHLNSLFNHESQKYRRSFFRKNIVRRITNFSNLAYSLFAGRGNEPAATLVYQEAQTDSIKPRIIHYAPLMVNQIINNTGKKSRRITWTITINENEISTLDPIEAETGDLVLWKTALWGSSRDIKIIKRLQRLFPSTLGELIDQKGWHFHKGLEVRHKSSGKGLESAPYLSGWKAIEVNANVHFPNTPRTAFRFTVPESILRPIAEEYLFTRKGRSRPFVLAKSPHLLIKAASGDCIFSAVDFVIPDPQLGIAATEDDTDYLRAISVFLNSSVIRYYLFFRSPSWGVGRSRVYPKDVRAIPLPIFSREQINRLSQLQMRLSHLEQSTELSNSSLQTMLDDSVEEVLSIPTNIRTITREFLSIKLQFNKGKSNVPASSPPSNEQLRDYGLTLRGELDTFTEGSGLRHRVELIYSKKIVVCSVEFIHWSGSSVLDICIKKAQRDDALLLDYIQEKVKQKFSQWFYVQRSIRIFEDSKIYICKSPRLIDWTKTQALIDSDDIISEILSVNHELHEVVQ
jgi:hypothetical protein